MNYIKNKIFTKNNINMISNITKDIHTNGINIHKSKMTSNPQFIMFDTVTTCNGKEMKNIANIYNNIDLNEALTNYNYYENIGNLKKIKISCADNPGIIHGSCNILSNMNINIINFTSDSYNAPFTSTNIFNLDMNIRVPKNINNDDIKSNMDKFIEEYNVDLILSNLN